LCKNRQEDDDLIRKVVLKKDVLIR